MHRDMHTAPDQWVPATVPGAVQLDWAAAQGWPPYWRGENFRAYDGLEDNYWTYEAQLEVPPLDPGKRLFFVCGGVDYRFTITLNGSVLLEQEGMFSPVELELTGRANAGDALRVTVYPAPKSQLQIADRSQADHSCKPAVSYGWDFHPRLIPLGIWEEVFLEVRETCFLQDAQTRYSLSEDLQTAELSLSAAINGAGDACRLRWTVIAPGGTELFVCDIPTNGETVINHQSSIADLMLWWPHDHGTPALHIARVELIAKNGVVLDSREQRIGFRRVRLIMAPGQWDWPDTFPKPRSNPPMTLEINGRAIFAKGANWVSPEIFPGLLNRDTYDAQLKLAKGANMNLLRIWGGGPAQKEAFYEICDKLGLMVWQEFPLACNCYPDDESYLRVLDQESRSLIKRLGGHASVVMWCGGNELFNSWSRMTDQSLPLRLLASNCYLLDPLRPFLPTSPVDGVGHGHYVFRDPKTGEEAWQIFQRSQYTAYCEFGCPGPAAIEILRGILPQEELFPPRPGGSWQAHHAFGVWMEGSHLYPEVLEHYFGPMKRLEELVTHGQLLQSEGYKGLFEEVRRQKPRASMALCWCLNEPWPAAANNSLLSWPSTPKPALAAVGEACRPLLASARVRKFQWEEDEVFDPELFWLNDMPEAACPGPIVARIEASGNRVWPLLTWDGGPLATNTNLPGPQIRWKLPDLETKTFTLVLETPETPAASSRYTLLFKPRRKLPERKIMNF